MWRPSCRIVKPPNRVERQGHGLRYIKPPTAKEHKAPEKAHFDDSVQAKKTGGMARSIHDELGRRQRVFDGEGEEIRARKSGERTLEDSLARKRRIDNMLDRRNGIPAAKLGDRLYRFVFSSVCPFFSLLFFVLSFKISSNFLCLLLSLSLSRNCPSHNHHQHPHHTSLILQNGRSPNSIHS